MAGEDSCSSWNFVIDVQGISHLLVMGKSGISLSQMSGNRACVDSV